MQDQCRQVRGFAPISLASAGAKRLIATPAACARRATGPLNLVPSTGLRPIPLSAIPDANLSRLERARLAGPWTAPQNRFRRGVVAVARLCGLQRPSRHL